MTKREVSSEDIANMLRIELSHAAIDLIGSCYKEETKERVHNQYTEGLMSVISIFGEKKRCFCGFVLFFADKIM